MRQPARAALLALVLLAPVLVLGCRARPLMMSAEQQERVQASAGAVLPIMTPTNAGTSFFITPDWGLTAAHVVEDVPPNAVITISRYDTGEKFDLSLALPPGADDPERHGRSDWAVLYRRDNSAPGADFLRTYIDTAHIPAPGDDVFTVGLSREQFELPQDERHARTLRLRVTRAPSGQDDSSDLIWAQWPFDTPPRGFSGGPVFAENERGELAAVGVNIFVYSNGRSWWLAARRITDEVVSFAEQYSGVPMLDPVGRAPRPIH